MQLVLFGGYRQGGGFLNDTWVWDGTNWAQTTPANPSDSPTARYVSAMAYDVAHQQVVKAAEFAEEMRRVVEASRTGPGCLGIQMFETFRGPRVFAIHSEWVDEAAFELHAGLPHTVRFLDAAEKLLSHPVQGLRLREIEAV